MSIRYRCSSMRNCPRRLSVRESIRAAVRIPSTWKIYRAAAPALDFFSPDNEYGEARAFGFSPFAVDTLPDVETAADESKKPNPLAQSYAVLQELADILPQAQREGRTRGLGLHVGSPRSSQTVSLGGYLFTATLARSWPSRNLLQDDGAMIVLQTGPDEFYIGGTALNVTVSVDVEAREGIAGIASLEEGSRINGEWTTARRLNGDQDNQGRSILLPDHQFKLLRVKL